MQRIDRYIYFPIPTNVFSSTDTMASSTGEQDPNHSVQVYIDTTIAATVRELLLSPNGHPSITLKRRPKNALFFINPGNGALDANTRGTTTTYSWPGKDAYEAWKFSRQSGSISCNATNPVTAVTLRILAAISEAVHAGLMISKRLVEPVCSGALLR